MALKRQRVPPIAPPRCTYGNHFSRHVIVHEDTQQSICANCFLDVAASWADVLSHAVSAAGVVAAVQETVKRKAKKR